MQNPVLAAAQPQQSALLDTRQAAEYLCVAPRTLEIWRSCKRNSIPYIKVGRRLVRYRRADLDRWLESQTADWCLE